MTSIHLTAQERAMRDGQQGQAASFCLGLLLQVARAVGARRLLPVESVHIDSCLYHGQAGLDFVEHLVKLGGKVVVPTSLNVGSLDLLHPERFRGDEHTRQQALRQMNAYAALGAMTTWTCAPYQIGHLRPRLGAHIAWAESNAIVFANSVLGARTERNGDFIDACAAITGRIPAYGLHLEQHRQGQVLFSLSAVPEPLQQSPIFHALIGSIVGQHTGVHIPVILGLPETTTEDQLKALGCATATTGSVALFHAVGLTPEATTLAEALGGQAPLKTVEVTEEMLFNAYQALYCADQWPIDGVCVGTPHFSVQEFGQLMSLLPGKAFRLPFYVSTSRHVYAEVSRLGWDKQLQAAGITVVLDTCTYITSILPPQMRVVLTNSAKWAYYAPANIGVKTAFGSLETCVKTAYLGHFVPRQPWWA